MSILEQRLQRRGENNLDFLRFFAAALVIVHHSIALLGYRWDPFGTLTGYATLGQLGVDIFFFMSGLLVTRSWIADPRPRAFIVKRGLRILPAFWAVILLGAAVAGPLLSRLPVRDYFADPNAAEYLRSLWLFPMRYSLPGVFTGNPSHAFNGSLWTLPLEALAYGAVLVAGALGGLTRQGFRWVLAGLGLWGIYYCTSGWMQFSAGAVSVHLRPDDESYLYFLLGAAVYVFRDSLPLDGRLALLAAALWLGTLSTGWVGYAVSFPTVAYLLLYAAVAPVRFVGHWGRYGDLSYGMYIYAFPIQQAFIHWFGPLHLTIAGLTVLSLPATMALAFVSWHVLEKPCLRLAKQRRHRPRPEDGVAVLQTGQSVGELPALSKLPAVP